MSNPNLQTQVRMVSRAGVIEIEGEVTGTAGNILEDAYAQASQPGVKAILLNFEKLDYLNSSGIGLLVTMLIRAQRQNLNLLACSLTDHYREIFQLTRLDEAIQLFENEQAALASID